MDKNRTLDDIFAAARTEAPVMQREESREVIQQAVSFRKRTWFRRIGMFGIAATIVVAGIWLAMTGENQSTGEDVVTQHGTARNPVSSPRRMELQGSSDQMPRISDTTMVSASHVHNPRYLLVSEGKASAITSPTLHDQNIGSVQTLELPNIILDSLGIRRMSDNTVLFHTMYSPDDSVMVFQLQNNDISPVKVPHATAPRYFDHPIWELLEPRMISDQRGKRILRSTFPRDGAYNFGYEDVLSLQNPQLSKSTRDSIASATRRFHDQIFDMSRLIPVRINASDTSYYIFWYEPTPEFLRLLPSPILARLRLETIASEMALYDADQDTTPRMNDLRKLHSALDSLISLRIDNGETIPLPDDARPGTSIMETSRITDGAISLYSISPNPNQGEFRMRYAVREQRVLGISVYDINGSKLHVAGSWREKGPEAHEVVVNITKPLPSGIYLLVLSTNKGERAVQRLVIERSKEQNVGEKRDLAATSPKTTAYNRTMEIIGVGMLPASPWLLDSLDIRVADSGRVYYQPSPIDPDRVLAFTLPKVDRPVTISTAEAPHITPWPARMKKWSKMITDDRGKRVSWNSNWDENDVPHDYIDVIRTTQDTASLTPEEIAELLRKVDSVRQARGIVEYARLFDLNRLVPVRVDVPDHEMAQTDRYKSSYYTFWYEPTPEFLAVMPDSTLVQIRGELAAATLALPDTGYVRRWNERFVATLRTTVDSLLDLRRRNGHVVPSDVKPAPGAGFFTIGQTSAGALAITSLAPNPSNGSARVRYLLNAPRSVEIALHDIHGTRMQVLSEMEAQHTGEHEQGIEFGDVPAGMYLLVVTTDKGERALQRLVVER